VWLLVTPVAFDKGGATPKAEHVLPSGRLAPHDENVRVSILAIMSRTDFFHLESRILSSGWLPGGNVTQHTNVPKMLSDQAIPLCP
jgi:hypothetical protein